VAVHNGNGRRPIRWSESAKVDAYDNGTLRMDMEATSRALCTADNAYVQQAMNSVHWERRGFLQRLTRRAR
jgi:hypothetical protein